MVAMVAINTDYAKTNVSTYHTRKMLETIANIGFTHVHWVHQWNGTDLYSVSEMEQIKQWLQELNLTIKGVHATDGTISGEFDDRKVFISPNELPNIGYESYADTYWEQLFKSFDSIVEYGKKKKVKIAIENLEYPSLEIQFDQFDRLFERYSFEELGFCYDLGHNMILSKSNPFAFLERYKDRLISLHLNCGVFNEFNETDYNKILVFDTHSVPNKELVDFDALSKLIAESPYELPVTFEISTAGGDIEKQLIETLNAGKEIDTLVKKYRNIK